jgi:hypothetical protein
VVLDWAVWWVVLGGVRVSMLLFTWQCGTSKGLCLPSKCPHLPFVGSVSRVETMHQVLGLKCKFPNYFTFTLGP